MSRVTGRPSWSARVLAQRNLGAPSAPSVLKPRDGEVRRTSELKTTELGITLDFGRVPGPQRRKVEQALARYTQTIRTLGEAAPEGAQKEVQERGAEAARSLFDRLAGSELFVPAFTALIGLLEGTNKLSALERLHLEPGDFRASIDRALDATNQIIDRLQPRSGLSSALHTYASFVSQLEAQQSSLDAGTHFEIWSGVGRFLTDSAPARGLDQEIVGRMGELIQGAITAESSPLDSISAAARIFHAELTTELGHARSILRLPSAVPSLAAALDRVLSAEPPGRPLLGKVALALLAAAEDLVAKSAPIDPAAWAGLVDLVDRTVGQPHAEDVLHWVKSTLPSVLADPGALTNLRARFEAEAPAGTAMAVALATIPHFSDPAVGEAVAAATLEVARTTRTRDPVEHLRTYAARYAEAHVAIAAHPALVPEQDAIARALAVAAPGLPALPGHYAATVLPLLAQLKTTLPAISVAELLADDAAGRPGILRALDPEAKTVRAAASILPGLFAGIAGAPDPARQSALVRYAIEIGISSARIGAGERHDARIAWDWQEAVKAPQSLKIASRPKSAVNVRAEERDPSVERFLDTHPELWREVAVTAGWWLTPAQLDWSVQLLSKMHDGKFARTFRDCLFACVETGKMALFDAMMSSRTPTKAIAALFARVGETFQSNTVATFPFDAAIASLAAGGDPVKDMDRAKSAELLPGVDLSALTGGRLDPEGLRAIERCGTSLADLLTRLDASPVGLWPKDVPYVDMPKVKSVLLELLRAEATGTLKALRYDSPIGRRQLAGLPTKEEWKQSHVTYATEPPASGSKALFDAMVTLKALGRSLGDLPLGKGELSSLSWSDPGALAQATSIRDGLWESLHEHGLDRTGLDQERDDKKSLTRARKDKRAAPELEAKLKPTLDRHAEISAKFAPVEDTLALLELKRTLDHLFAEGGVVEPQSAMLTVQPLLERAKRALIERGGLPVREAITRLERAGRDLVRRPKEGHYAIDEDSFESIFNTFTLGCMSVNEPGRQWGKVDTAANAHSKMVRVFKDGEQRFRGVIRTLDAELEGYRGKVLWIEPPKNDGGRPGAPANTGDDEDWALFYKHVINKGQALGIPVVIGVQEDMRHHLVKANPFHPPAEGQTYPAEAVAQAMGHAPLRGTKVTFKLEDGWTGAMQSDPLFWDPGAVDKITGTAASPAMHDGSGYINWYRTNEFTSRSGQTFTGVRETYDPTVTADVIVMPKKRTADTAVEGASTALRVDDIPAPTPRPRKVRFAPSPTGSLHVGHVAIALSNYLYAKKLGGSIDLRFEDTDPTKAQVDLAKAVREDLEWLGLRFDGPPILQSKRTNVYVTAAEKLVASGAAYRADGAIWFRMPPDPVQYVEDTLRGRVACTFQDPETGSSSPRDFVLVGADRLPKFELANVLDDIEQKVTHVIRGEDQLHNGVGARQVCLYHALGAEVPELLHLGIITGDDDKKLSKRKKTDLPTTIKQLRELGVTPEIALNHVARIMGMRDDGFDIKTLDQLVESFDPYRLRTSATNIDFAGMDRMIATKEKTAIAGGDVARMQKALVAAAPAFTRLIGKEATLALADLSIARAKNVDDAILTGQLIIDTPTWRPADKVRWLDTAIAEQARARLEKLEAKAWTLAGLQSVARELTASKDAGGTLRWMLLGVPDGPPLANILTILGRDQVLRRIAALVGEAA